MQKLTDSSQSAASTDSPAEFTTPTTRSGPPVATFRQYLEGPAEAFELARRQARATSTRAASTRPGGAPGADARRLYVY
ncbi:hypothetical protein [Hymenobacter nivis]|uniref:Uncharacterized protein n=1 Tax=Hymenobacter nivis TaxID=1850093 RepID=A0A2Z3GWR8_9BACT|nr:hypothetical protein [Hymenobacter nivis]AWM33864.1 hypothetical protein DDQ68_14335 [Hymenobacter nivis]